MLSSRVFRYILSSIVLFEHARGQQSGVIPGVGFPHNYPGKPSGDFSPAWQHYFQVTMPLPNVTFALPRNWAGNIAVDRAGHPNNTLFFWAFEKEHGSFTAAAGERSDEPWGIWLNGGPGSSSMVGLLFENGPLHVASDFSLFSNKFAWSKIADYVWIDQPVGTGFSTTDNTGFVANEDQTGEDFMSFLANFVKVYPSLAHRPLYITGESYAGKYIPYILKTYFGMKEPPVKIAGIAIGDGSIGNDFVNSDLPVVTILETYPQIIGYDPAVLNYFKEQSHLCNYDVNLTYPQTGGHFPTISPSIFSFFSDSSRTRRQKLRLLNRGLRADDTLKTRDSEPSSELLFKREQWKRDLTGRPNGTLDPIYRCDLLDEMLDYAFNFSLPWQGHLGGFNEDDVPSALSPAANMDASVFLNNNVTRAAIHAPTSKDWVETITYFFGGLPFDPSVEAIAFFDDLATNASRHDVKVVIYSGNDDGLVTHRGSEVNIQNTTFGGIQGFSRRPSTHWFDDEGKFAGIVHQERGWTYVLVNGAGHLVPQQQPQRAMVLLREYIIGNNPTGLVTEQNGHTTVIGGEDKKFNGVLPGQLGIFTGSGTTHGTYTFPSATIAAWEAFTATALAFSPTG